MPKKKRFTRVQMYFSEDTKQIYEDLQQVAKTSGFSVSEVAYIAFATGFPMVKDGILKLMPKQLSKLPRSKSK